MRNSGLCAKFYCYSYIYSCTFSTYIGTKEQQMASSAFMEWSIANTVKGVEAVMPEFSMYHSLYHIILFLYFAAGIIPYTQNSSQHLI